MVPTTREVVIDANVAVCFSIAGEHHRQKVRRFLRHCADRDIILVSPPLFESESDGVIRRLVYNSRMSPEAAMNAQKALIALPVRIIHSPGVRAVARRIAESCNQERVYDATYAALAELRQCEFWTADGEFYESAKDILAFVRHVLDFGSEN